MGPLRCCATVLSLVLSATAQDDVAALTKRLDSSDAAVRRQAADKLAELGPKAVSAIAVLDRRLCDKEVAVAEASARALGRIGKPATPRLRAALLKQESAESAMIGVEALGAAGAELVPEMLTAYEKVSNFDRCNANAEKAVKAIGAAAVKPLREGLKDRGHSEFAARLLGSMKEVAAPATSDLVAVLADRGRLSAARSDAASALSQIGEPAQSAVPKILAVVLDEKDESGVRISALGAIAAIRTEDPEALKAIEGLRNSKDKDLASRVDGTLQMMKRPRKKT